MLKWVIKGSEEFAKFVSERRFQFGYSTEGVKHSLFYFIHPYTQKLTWSLSPPYDYTPITIDQLKELYPLMKSTADNFTIKGSAAVGKFIRENLFPTGTATGENPNFYYHYEKNRLTASISNDWEQQVIDLRELQKLFKVLQKPIQLTFEQLKNYNGAPYRAKLLGRDVKGVIKITSKKVVFLQNEIAGNNDFTEGTGYEYSFSFTADQLENMHRQVTDFYFDVKKFKLIKAYPGRTIGDKVTFEGEYFAWESDGVKIPQDFQPDVTPDWFAPIYVVPLSVPTVGSYQLKLDEFKTFSGTNIPTCITASFGCAKFSVGYLRSAYAALTNVIVNDTQNQVTGVNIYSVGMITLGKIKEILDYIDQEELARNK